MIDILLPIRPQQFDDLFHEYNAGSPESETRTLHEASRKTRFAACVTNTIITVISSLLYQTETVINVHDILSLIVSAPYDVLWSSCRHYKDVHSDIYKYSGTSE